MLILSRNVGESIFINGEEIKIHFLSSRGNQIRIGIEAPKNMSVDRQEIYVKKLNFPIKKESNG